MATSLTHGRARRAVSNPLAALRYLSVQWKKRRDPERERARLFAFLDRHFDTSAERVYASYRASTFRRWYRERLEALAREPRGQRATSSTFDCEVLYLLARAVRPAVVVETGVLHGASTAHLLQALEENGHGELYSIDFAAAPGELPRDYLVPPPLTSRWSLLAGDSRDVLPTLLDRIGGCDLFHHDSLHTYEHMMWEYRTAGTRMGAGAVLSSHDVLSGLWAPNAFEDFCAAEAAERGVFRNMGIALLRAGPGAD